MPSDVHLRQPLTLDECFQIAEWRNAPDVMPILRTGYKSREDQEAFYRDVICNPDAEHRYYAVEVERHRYWPDFAGVAGLTYINYAKCETEISLVLGPAFRGKGIGTAAVDCVIREARSMGLTVVGECYPTGNLKFWTKMVERHKARMFWRFE